MKKEFTPVVADFRFGFVNVRPEHEDEVKNLVNYKVLRFQYDKIYKSLPVDQWNAVNPGGDFWNATPETFTTSVCDPDELPDVLEARKNALTVKAELDKLPVNADSFNAISDADKAFIVIEAHKNVKGIVLNKDLAGDADLKKVVEKAYKNATVNKETRESIRSILYRILGRNGNLFYAVAPTRADIPKDDAMHFMASFGGSAKRAVSKKGGVEVVASYDYVLRNNSKSIYTALTELCGVVLESRRGQICNVKH